MPTAFTAAKTALGEVYRHRTELNCTYTPWVKIFGYLHDLFTRNHQVDWRLVAASNLNLLYSTRAIAIISQEVSLLAVALSPAALLAPRTAPVPTFCYAIKCSRKRMTTTVTSFDPCWKDLSESHHQYYDQTACIHLPDSTHNSSQHMSTAVWWCIRLGYGLGWFVSPKFSLCDGLGWVGSVVWWAGLRWGKWTHELCTGCVLASALC